MTVLRAKQQPDIDFRATVATVCCTRSFANRRRRRIFVRGEHNSEKTAPSVYKAERQIVRSWLQLQNSAVSGA